MIIKLQRPMNKSEGGASPWLAYDERRRRYFAIREAEVPSSVLAAMGNNPKAYFDAVVIGKHLKIGARVEDQEW